MEKAIKKVWFDNGKIWASTTDGEIVTKRLEVYPALLEATEEQREDFEIWDEGQSIRWESIDEDINITDLYEKDVVNYDNDVNRLLSKFPYLNLKVFAEQVGMHWTKLARYKYGVWTPSEEEFADIKKGLHEIANEMLEVV